MGGNGHTATPRCNEIWAGMFPGTMQRVSVTRVEDGGCSRGSKGGSIHSGQWPSSEIHFEAHNNLVAECLLLSHILEKKKLKLERRKQV